ncbi:SCAN domain-containing protein 3-like [Lepeophtheirus salmonis]|uniref:SCAN domain-containing protein 3-like n=1 Tax=Lepeophtheirus salmonis TaxID=72036 RepID=UPI001AE0F755|nr:SCAN domain-containing protein 3-like [Lepeophtheirus salmonis]
MEFTFTSSCPPMSLCFSYGEKLANSGMKPTYVLRHFKTKHPSHVGREPEFFKRKLSEFRSSQDTIRKASTISAKALDASLLITKAEKRFTRGEDLLIPFDVLLVVTLLYKNAAEKFKTIPLPNDSVCCQVERMGTYIVDPVVAKLSNSFSLQLDESTDVSGNIQLVAFVRYVVTGDIYEYILFCKTVDGRTTGEDILYVIYNYF